MTVERELYRLFRRPPAAVLHVADALIEEAIRTNNPGLLEAHVNTDLLEAYIAESLAEAMRVGTLWGRREIAKARKVRVNVPAALRVSFDMTDPWVSSYIKKRSAALVTEVSQSTRKAIRAVIHRAYMTGIHPYDQVPLVRAALGPNPLHERWANAVYNFMDRQLRSGAGLERAEALTAAYRDRLIDARALMIARTETLAAQNAGRLNSWMELARAGLVGELMGKQWSAAPEGPCEVCDELDGTIIPLDTVFVFGGEMVEHPPIHPHCRCTLLLVENEPMRGRLLA